METQNNTDDRQKKILFIKNAYKKVMGEIVNLAKKLGWNTTDMEEHPEILLHVFFEYLDIIK